MAQELKILPDGVVFIDDNENRTIKVEFTSKREVSQPELESLAKELQEAFATQKEVKK